MCAERQDEQEEAKPLVAMPGPWPSLPILGTRWEFFPLIGRYDVSKLHEVHLQRYYLYGPIFKEYYQWGRCIVHLYDPKDYATVFTSQGRYPLRPPNEFVTKLRLANPGRYPTVGFANLNGEEWRVHRNKLAPAIVKLKAIDEHIPQLNDVADSFIDYVRANKDAHMGVLDNLQAATYKFALESICSICLDTRIGCFDRELHGDADQLIEATKELFDSFNELYYGAPLWKYFATSGYARLERAESRIYDIASKYVERAIDDLCEDDQNHTVLKRMLRSQELTKDEVKINLIDFIAGGIFTVSNTLNYLFYHLAANPEVQQELFEEIDRVTNGGGGDHHVDQTHINGMSYLKACLKECFRLTCPVPGIMRVTSEPLVLSGYHVPANTVVFSHTMTTCLIDKYFSKPNQFYPRRWLNSGTANNNNNNNEKVSSYAVLPFGYGTRTCIGKRLSETEIYLLTAKLLANYRIELADGQTELQLLHAFLVIPSKRISLRFVPRS